MLIVPVGENQKIQVTFDVTGGGDFMICYYIREVKIKLKTCYWKNRLEQVERLKSTAQYEIPYCSYSYTESRSALVLTLHLKKLIGFYSLAYFQPAIEQQYNEIFNVLSNEIDEENDPFQIEMVLDVIY